MPPRNFGRDAERASKRASKAAFEEVVDERWQMPDDPPVAEEVERWIESPETRVTHRTVRYRENRRVADYAFVHEICLNGSWVEIAKIDCAHGEVHKHWPPPDESGRLQRIVILPIYSQEDVEKTYQDSLNEIYDNLEENERKWRDGR